MDDTHTIVSVNNSYKSVNNTNNCYQSVYSYDQPFNFVC